MDATRNVRKRKYTPRSPKQFSCTWCEREFLSSAIAPKFCGSSCKERARYDRDRELRRSAVAAYRQVNRERINANRRLQRAAAVEHYREQARKSYLKHRDRRIREAVEYQKNNPMVVARTRHRRRAVEQLAVSIRDLNRLLARHRGECAYCSRKLEKWGRQHANSLQWDHVLALSAGGRHSIGNLLPVCRDCNLRKGNTFLAIWRAASRYGLEESL